MAEEALNAFTASVQKNLKHLQEARATYGPDGDPPASLVAESDQFLASSAELLDILVRAARRHRTAGHSCCAKTPACVGYELPVSIASLSEAALGHVLGALTVAARRLADLPEEASSE